MYELLFVINMHLTSSTFEHSPYLATLNSNSDFPDLEFESKIAIRVFT